MHDPSTLAFSIKIPLPWRKPTFRAGFKSGKFKGETEWTSYHLADIWHEDPQNGPGGDDSCGWFMRSHHGNKEVLERIIKRFSDDWDRVFKSEETGKIYHLGYFIPNGEPNMSTPGIVLNLFFLAAGEHFNVDGGSNWKKARCWMQDNLFDILLFAENPTDSMRDSIIGIWGSDKRDDRIRGAASCIYGWILRETRPWYKHPRWHFWHWKIQCHPLGNFKRWAFSRCCKCGKGFKWGYAPVTNSWNSEGPRWFRGETDVYHSDCNHPASDCIASSQTEKTAVN